MAKPVISYADLSTELDEVLQALQNPEVDLDEAVRLYKRGLELVTALEKQVKTAENTITKLKLQAGVAAPEKE